VVSELALIAHQAHQEVLPGLEVGEEAAGLAGRGHGSREPCVAADPNTGCSAVSDGVSAAGACAMAASSTGAAPPPHSFTAAAGIPGVLLVVAAKRYDPAQPTGLDAGLQVVADEWYGPALLVVLALGLVAFGVYCFFDARSRKA
jgi:hypothetical protein